MAEELRVGFAAQFLNVSSGTVYALVNEGKLSHIRKGSGRGSIRFLQEHLDAYKAATIVLASAPSKDRPSPVLAVTPTRPAGKHKHIGQKPAKARG